MNNLRQLLVIVSQSIFGTKSKTKCMLKGDRIRHDYSSLESRQMLTTFFVNSIADDASGVADGTLTLREALIAAETNAPFGDAVAGEADGDVIRFAPELLDQTIVLSEGELFISDDLRINGDDYNITISGNDDTRVFYVDSDELVAIRNLNIEDGRSLDRGAAFKIAGEGQFILNGVSISNSRDTSIGGGGGAIATTGSNVLILHSNLNANHAEGEFGKGGGILIEGGHVRIVDSTISGNEATYRGGGIAVLEGNFTLVDSSVGTTNVGSGNQAQAGGGIFVAPGSSESRNTIFNSNVLNNVAETGGGGVHNGSEQTLLIRRSLISANSVTGSESSTAGGGGILNQGTTRFRSSMIVGNESAGVLDSGGGGILSTDGLLSLINSTVTSNQSVNLGGGLLAVGGRVFLRNATFGGDNSAEGNIAETGGGIAIAGAETQANFRDLVANNNSANANGGGIAFFQGRLDIANSEIGGELAIDGNNAQQGGGLYLTGTDTTIITIKNTLIAGNTASLSGGGLWNSNTDLAIRNSEFANNVALGASETLGGGGVFVTTSQFLIVDSSIRENQAIGFASGGGGIFIQGGGDFNNSLLGTFRNVDFSENFTTGNGGGMRSQGLRANLDDVIFRANVAENETDADLGNGGGLHATASLNSFDSLQFVRSHFFDNAAKNGGAIWTNTTLGLSLESSLVRNEVVGTAEGSGGGAVYVADGRFSFSGVAQNNRAQGTGVRGGAIYAANGRISIGGAFLTANTSSSDGGAVFVEQAIFTVSNTIFKGNTAGVFNGVGDGGAIYTESSVNIRNSSFIENSADGSGGAIWVGQGLSVDSFVGNGRGERSSFIENSSADNGGALFLNQGFMRVYGASFNRNSAEGVGGAIMLMPDTESRIRFSQVSSNLAANGAGIFNMGESLITMTQFVQNRATDDPDDNTVVAGAIFTDEFAESIVVNNSFLNNTPSDQN